MARRHRRPAVTDDGTAAAGLRLLAAPAHRPAARAWLREGLPGWLGAEVAIDHDPVTGSRRGYRAIGSDSRVRAVRVAYAVQPDGSAALALAWRPDGQLRWAIDLAAPALPPEWRELAPLYLGPEAAAALQAAPAGSRASAFARVWTAHEARCKAEGRGLSEWDAARAPREACLAVAWPDSGDARWVIAVAG